jgi:hypothetical protein
MQAMLADTCNFQPATRVGLPTISQTSRRWGLVPRALRRDANSSRAPNLTFGNGTLILARRRTNRIPYGFEKPLARGDTCAASPLRASAGGWVMFSAALAGRRFRAHQRRTSGRRFGMGGARRRGACSFRTESRRVPQTSSNWATARTRSHILKEGPDLDAVDKPPRRLALEQSLDARRIEYQRADEVRMSLQDLEQLSHGVVVVLHGLGLVGWMQRGEFNATESRSAGGICPSASATPNSVSD